LKYWKTSKGQDKDAFPTEKAGLCARLSWKDTKICVITVRMLRHKNFWHVIIIHNSNQLLCYQIFHWTKRNNNMWNNSGRLRMTHTSKKYITVTAKRKYFLNWQFMYFCPAVSSWNFSGKGPRLQGK
jgi:hypothetical protein